MVSRAKIKKRSPRASFKGLRALPVNAPVFSEIARLIAGSTAPGWLAEFFEDWTPSISMDEGVANFQPTRKEMRERLRTLLEAVTAIRKALNDSATIGFLHKHGGPLQEKYGFARFLDDIDIRARKADSTLLGPDGKTKSGRSRALPEDAFSPKVHCAAVVVEAWRFIHKDEPAPSNQKIAKAAELLWEAAGGETGSFSDKTTNGWRHFVKQVRSPLVDAWSREIAEHLRQSAHQWDCLHPKDEIAGKTGGFPSIAE